jgi:hypothetical protein
MLYDSMRAIRVTQKATKPAYVHRLEQLAYAA